MTVEKTVSGRSPYIGRTFQKQTELIAGRSGYVSGAETSDNGATITVGPFAFMQNGLIVEESASVAGTSVPSGAEPWFLLGSSADDDPDSGVALMATNDTSVAFAGIILSYKVNGTWQNPSALSLQGLEDRDAAEAGKENGFRVEPILSGGNLSTFDLTSGRVVGSRGIRRDLVGPASAPSSIDSITPFLPHEQLNRTDHLVLRQNSDLPPSIVYVQGATESFVSHGASGGLTIPSGSGTTGRPHYFHRRGGGIADQWWAWGEGNNLRILGGPSAEHFAASTLVAGGASVTEAYIVGQRESDDAIVVLFLEGSALRIVSFVAATGFLEDAAVTIDTEPNAITHPRGAFGPSEDCHVVYQHDENGTGLDEQVYYTRLSIQAASFGAAAITPRIVDGADSAKSDTGPVIGVDDTGVSHIAYITGTGGTSNVFGELRYSTIDRTGVLTFQKTYSNTTDVGKDLDPDDSTPIEVYSAGGTTVDNLRSVDLVVTVHGEVYAVVLLKDSGDAEVFDVALFSPTFEDRLGFGVAHINRATGTTVRYNDCGIVSDEQGQIFCVLSHYQGTFEAMRVVRIDTVFAPNGLVGPSVLGRGPDTISTVDPVVDEMLVDLGYAGDIAISEQDGGGAVQTATFGLNCTDEVGGLASPPTPHPNDVYLASWRVPTDVTPVLPESNIQVSHTRTKGAKYPFLVGGDGDFQGCNSIQYALRIANQNQGTIIIRSGHHYLNGPITVQGGVHLIGEGMPVLDWGDVSLEAPMIDVQGGASIVVSGISGQVVTLATDFAKVRSGDLVNMATSGFHRVIRRINDKAVLDGIVPVGATMQLFPAGVVMENLYLTGRMQDPADHFVRLLSANKCVMRNMAFRAQGAFTAGSLGVLVDQSRDCLLEGLDFSSWQSTGLAEGAINLTGGFGNEVRGCLLRGDIAQLEIEADESHPRVIDCLDADGATGVNPTYNIIGARAANDPVLFGNSLGIITGASASSSKTYVGERISVADSTRAMAFEDVNTVAGAAPSGRILLTDGSNQEFNSGGATVGVITGAVNARVRLAGDTMSGNLVMGGDILTDGAKQVLGATGTADTGKFEVFADDLHIRGNIDVAQDPDIGHEIQGRNSIIPATMHPYGLIEPLGARYFDDFIRPIAAGDAASFWASATGGATQFYNTVRLVTTVSDDNLQALVSRESITGDALPGFSANIRLVDFNTLRRDSVGWDEVVSVFSVFRDTDTSNNWFIAFRDDGNTNQTIDTGSSLATIDTWLYITLIMVSPTSVLFRISDNQVWGQGSETIVFDNALPGTGTIKQDSGIDWDFALQLTTRSAAIREASFGFVHLFGTVRPSGSGEDG